MYFWRKPCGLVVLGFLSWGAVAAAQVPAAQQRSAARRFLAHRGMASRAAAESTLLNTAAPDAGVQPAASFARALAAARSIRVRQLAELKARRGPGATAEQRAGQAAAQLPASLGTTWSPIGPDQTITAAYGAITGRVTSIAVDPADATGNTVYAGTTGGGVWKSVNAAGVAALVTFHPITDDATGSDTGIPSLSIGAMSVQPAGPGVVPGVVLAGTGDPNDSLDSYYGSGILRSTDHGATWTTITDADLDETGQSFSFYGEGFSGFAWSTATPNLVVAAVTQAYDGTVVNATQSNSVDGLYYSTDAGATWQMSTLTDGNDQVFQSPTTTAATAQGNAVTAVVWNPIRRQFYAAIRYHGYYSSPDGVTWTRLVNQPGANLSPTLCPEFGSSPGSASCPIFRGALAVQPATGDMFAFTVDGNLIDQGIWQDVCAASGGACTTSATVLFGTQIADAELENGNGQIAQGDYNLSLAAVPSNADTLLYAGTIDIFKRSLAAANVPWRNTTNVTTCAAARVAPAQHAIAVAPTGLSLYFGNDGGLWRTTDGIGQEQTACSADDAAHFTNLNGSLGSLAEVTSVSQSPGNDGTMLAGDGVNGTAATTSMQGGWPQVLDGLGGYTAIDPANAQNWYMTSGPGVSISFCGSGASCVAADFAEQATIGDAQTASDGESLGEPAVWMLDPQDPTRLIVGTCRLWRGSVAGSAVNWAAANAISPVLDDSEAPDCTEGAGQIQSLAGSGTIAGTTMPEEILYVGMEGTPRGGGALPYGGLAAGHVFTATVSVNQSGPAAWTDVFASPVVNGESDQGQFNPGGFGISSVVIDTHDASGQTVYSTIQGFSGNGINEPTVYRSTNQGQSWTNITANLPTTPVNALVVDPGDANIVYLATDAGVYATTAVATCGGGAGQCWSPYGSGLPDAPVTTLVTDGAANDSLLIAGTYGRGAWEMLLASSLSTGNGGLTSAQLSPASVTFASQAIGSESATTAVTVKNTGSFALLVSGVTATGDFTEQDDCVGKSMAAGAVCTLNVAFAPTAQGTRNGTLTVLANVANGQVSAILSGLGKAPGQIVLEPVHLVFPSTMVGATTPAQYLTVSNTGTNAVTLASPTVSGNFQINSTSCTASDAGQTGCTVGIVFSPKAGGVENGTFSISTGAGVFEAQVSGTGLAPATDTLSPNSLVFAAQAVGTASAAQTVIITNSGDSAVTLIAATSSLGDFRVNDSACATNLPGHASCAISVYFAPIEPGQRKGSLTIADSLHAGSSALKVTLTGSGTAPPGVVSMTPSSLDFGSEGTPLTPPLVPAQAVTLTNNSGGAITGLNFAATGDFSVSAGTCGASLGAGATCNASITFSPKTTGPRMGVLTATGSSLGAGLATALSGVGLDYTMSVDSATSVTVVTGTPASFQVGITPAGASSGLLSLTCTSAPALPAGSACTLNPASVQLTSGATGSATISITTPALATSSRLDWRDSGWVLAFALPFLGLPGRSRRRFLHEVFSLSILLVGVVFAGGLAGCGASASGGSKTSSTGTTGGGIPPAYILTVTASAPGIQQAVSMTLRLEQ